MYATFKHSHMLFIVVSFLLFEFRYVLKVMKKPQGKFLTIFPHINDTLLLVTGVSLAFIAGFNIFEQTWLSAKIIALFLYIGFGVLALKSSGIKSFIGFVLATATFIFIVLTALKKTPYLIG